MKVIVFLCILFGIPARLMSQDAMLEVLVSKDTIYLGNQVKVTFVASNTSGRLEIPTFDGFDLVAGPITSSSYSYINGVESRKTTYVYILEPNLGGKLIIGQARITGNKPELSTREITIFVKSNPDGIRESPDGDTGRKENGLDIFRGFDSFEDLFNMPQPRQERVQPEEKPKLEKRKYNFKTESI